MILFCVCAYVRARAYEADAHTKHHTLSHVHVRIFFVHENVLANVTFISAIIRGVMHVFGYSEKANNCTPDNIFLLLLFFLVCSRWVWWLLNVTWSATDIPLYDLLVMLCIAGSVAILPYFMLFQATCFCCMYGVRCDVRWNVLLPWGYTLLLFYFAICLNCTNGVKSFEKTCVLIPNVMYGACVSANVCCSVV